MRSIKNLTQRELAARAGVSHPTIVCLEKGRPVRPKTVRLVCRALDTSLEEMLSVRTLNLKSPAQDYVLHRAEKSRWVAFGDRRRNPPSDNQERIQYHGERQRLGSAGLVEAFGTGPDFVLREGPGLLIDEIYGRSAVPSGVYRDCVLYCLRGGLLFEAAETLVLSQGDCVAFVDGLAAFVSPSTPVRLGDEPPLALWIGANRIGRVP